MTMLRRNAVTYKDSKCKLIVLKLSVSVRSANTTGTVPIIKEKAYDIIILIKEELF